MGQTTEPFSPGQLLGGKYRLDRILGQGGMGSVWAAENVDIGRKVAIKMLHPHLAADPAVLARFRQEARAAASIGHPGIIDVFDLGQLPTGEAFLVMQHLQGQTIAERIEQAGAFDVATAVQIVGDVLDAIGAAHARGIVHRDLKPENVFLTESPVRSVKVLDFGISRFHGDENPVLTRTGIVLGTPAYMSPEQARGAKELGPASDLYAIGAILYEMLAGVPAFDGDTYNEILAKILTEEKVPIAQLRPDVPEPIRRFIDAMMARSPSDRPATAADAKRLLLAPGPAAPQPAPAPIPLVNGRTGARAPATDPALDATVVRPESRLSVPAAEAPRTETAPTGERAGAASLLVRQALPLALLAVALGAGAAALRTTTMTFFAGAQGLVAGAALGACVAVTGRRGAFAAGWAAALAIAGAILYLASELLVADLSGPYIVTAGWLAQMLRGDSQEWIWTFSPRAGALGLAGGDVLFAATLADAAVAAAVAVAAQRIAARKPEGAVEIDAAQRRAAVVVLAAAVIIAAAVSTVIALALT